MFHATKTEKSKKSNETHHAALEIAFPMIHILHLVDRDGLSIFDPNFDAVLRRRAQKQNKTPTRRHQSVDQAFHSRMDRNHRRRIEKTKRKIQRYHIGTTDNTNGKHNNTDGNETHAQDTNRPLEPKQSTFPRFSKLEDCARVEHRIKEIVNERQHRDPHSRG